MNIFPCKYKHYTLRLGPKVPGASSDIMVGVIRATSDEPGHTQLNVALAFTVKSLLNQWSSEYEDLIVQTGMLSLREMIDKFCEACDPIDEKETGQAGPKEIS